MGKLFDEHPIGASVIMLAVFLAVVSYGMYGLFGGGRPAQRPATVASTANNDLTVETTTVSDFEAGFKALDSTSSVVQIVYVEMTGTVSTTPSVGDDAWPPKLTRKQIKTELATIDAISADNWATLKQGSKDFGPSSHGSVSDVVLPYICEVAANGHKREAQMRLDDLKKYVAACLRAGVQFPDNIFKGKPWIWGDLKETQAYIKACK